MGCNQGGSKAPAEDATASGSKGGGGGGGAKATQDRDKDKKAANEDNKNYQETMEFLGKVALFKRLPKDSLPILAHACVAHNFKANDVVIKQGASGSEFFVIKSGEAAVFVQTEGASAPKKVATLKLGDYFGENSLLRDEPRTATIKAVTALKTFKITRDKFQELELNMKLQFANRKAVQGGGARVIATKEPSPKTDQQRKIISDAIKRNDNLATMVTLDDARVNQMIEVAWKENVPAGKELITEGDLVADYFYVVQEGAFEIFVSVGNGEADEEAGEAAEREQKQKLISTVGAGASFGELALLYLVPRAATVKAKEDAIVWVIDRTNFKSILMKVSENKIGEYMKHLDRVTILESLLQEEKKAIAQAFIEMHFAKNEVILQQGEAGNTFYILYDGEVAVVKDGKEQVRLAASPAKAQAQYFGERALIRNEPRDATVCVTSETAKALALDRDSFDLLLGPLEEIIKRSQDTKGQGGRPSLVKGAGAMKPEANKQDKARERVERKQLTKIGLLGCGGFGAVELYEHKVSGETYAMKGLSKGYIVKTGMQESVMNEKNILLMTNSPFIVKLYETYNGAQTLYFLLEPALGGELYATYNKKGFHGSEKHAKFYVAGVVFAFDHVHARRIIYRDLKPENLLIAADGRMKLTDMGLAKFVIGKTYTTCGTPDYFAPELIASTGHTNAVDWWTLGILVFELMSGHPPFESAYPMQTYSKVMKGIQKIAFPPKCQGAVCDVIKGLLMKDPSQRLPMRPGGSKNLKDQKWFGSSNFKWQEMESLEMTPPYMPVVKSKKDIANFTVRKEDMPRQLEYVDDGSGWDAEFST